MKKIPTAQQLIELWQLEKMQTEGVMYVQNYISPRTGADGKRLSTAIVALLTDDPASFSDMHRLPADEIWHFYFGDPIELLLLNSDRTDELMLLGHDVLDGQLIQVVVPSGTWMGARLRPGGRLAVFGNTMAPGYEVSDFEGAVVDNLVADWPHRAELIRAMTREGAPIRYA